MCAGTLQCFKIIKRYSTSSHITTTIITIIIALFKLLAINIDLVFASVCLYTVPKLLRCLMI